MMAEAAFYTSKPLKVDIQKLIFTTGLGLTPVEDHKSQTSLTCRAVCYWNRLLLAVAFVTHTSRQVNEPLSSTAVLYFHLTLPGH